MSRKNEKLLICQISRFCTRWGAIPSKNIVLQGVAPIVNLIDYEIVGFQFHPDTLRVAIRIRSFVESGEITRRGSAQLLHKQKKTAL
jgi:hypothetical protein